jgi:quercetin dioxygenase-like cupin family protein
MMSIEGLKHDKTYMHITVAQEFATDTKRIFKDETIRGLGLVYNAGLCSTLVQKAGLFYEPEALEYFAKRDANEGLYQIDREGMMLANFEEDERIPEDVRKSIKHLQAARTALNSTGHGLVAAEILRYQPGAKLQTHTDRARTTSISLDGEATMYIGEDTQDEYALDTLLPGHAVSLEGHIPHRIKSSPNSLRHVLLLTDSLPSEN